MVRVVLKRSRCLAAVLIAVHGAAAATLVPLAIPGWAQAALALLIAASLWRALRRHAWLTSRASVTSIELREPGWAMVETGPRGREEARILGTTYISALLCVVNLRVAGRAFARHAVLVPDNVDADSFRRLRVALRWGYRGQAERF